MRFHLHLDHQTAKEISKIAKKLGETRNGLIRKTVREWLGRKAPGTQVWSPVILEWRGIPDFPSFESYRGELVPSCDDSFV